MTTNTTRSTTGPWTIDTLANPLVMAAATTDEQRKAVAVARAFERLAEDGERALRRAEDIDGDDLGEQAAVIRAYADVLRRVVPQARHIATRSAVAVLVDLAAATDPTTDAGATIRRVAMTRYGVRLNEGARAATGGDPASPVAPYEAGAPAEIDAGEVLPCYDCRRSLPLSAFLPDRRTRRGRSLVCHDCRRGAR